MPTFNWGDAVEVGQTQDFSTPRVATLADGNFVMVWTSGAGGSAFHVVYQIFDPTGAPLTDPVMATQTSAHTSLPSVYATATGFNIVMTVDYAETDRDTLFVEYNLAGVDTSTQYIASTALDETAGVGALNVTPITAFVRDGDIVFRVTDSEGAPGLSTTIPLATDDREPFLATLYGDRTGLVWVNSNNGIMVQIIYSDGSLSDGAFAAGPSNAFVGSPEIVGLADGGYVVTWASVNIGTFATSINQRVFNEDGSARTAPLSFPSGHPGSVTDVELIATDDGGYLAVYSVGPSGLGAPGPIDLMGAYYDSSGHRTGAEFYVATGGSQSNPALSRLADGRIVVAYTDNSGTALFQIIDGRDGLVNGTNGVDHLYGSDLISDQLTGANGDDFLYGLAGNDRLDGGKGADRMEGGLGDDTFYVDNVGDTVIELLGQGYDTVRSAINFSLVGKQIEALALTGVGNTSATGNSLDNTLTGNSGNNTLNGGVGVDIMAGGFGNDTYVIDTLEDVITELANQGTDTIQSGLSLTLVANVENLTLTGTADLTGTGNSLANSLTGNNGANVLDGKAGADTMTGGAGDDTYVVDDAGDTVKETSAADGVDTVLSGITYKLTANVENLTLTGNGAISGTGTSLDNVILGNGAANTITGGGGADTLTGGVGADIFVYKSTADSSVTAFDRITDFSSIDKIDLSAVDANSNLAGDQAFAIVSAFTNVAGQMTLAYSSSTKLTTILMDVNGDGAADMKIVLDGDRHTYTNFVF